MFSPPLSLSHPHTHTHTHACTPTQLVMGDEAVLTFGCSTFIEREEWTEAFRILNQMAPAFVGSEMAGRTPIKGKLR